MILTTLVAGAHAAEREAAIAAALQPGSRNAVLLEGMPGGNSPLDEWQGIDGIDMHRIAAGCPCCVGNLTMRVMLNRLIRQSPSRLYISLATSMHIDQVRELLVQAPYSEHLRLTDNWLL